MESFARMLALQIEAEENAQLTETALLQERETAELREQFIAVLGHDLRNPLFAISAGARNAPAQASDPAIDVRVRNISAVRNGQPGWWMTYSTLLADAWARAFR
jgi:signal transduction histidine kinase